MFERVILLLPQAILDPLMMQDLRLMMWVDLLPHQGGCRGPLLYPYVQAGLVADPSGIL
jgi:hypothetical protein